MRIRGAVGDDAPGRFDAVQLRHRDVHQDDIRLEALGLTDRFATIGGLSDNFNVGLG
jgi:hypothetical protein